MLRNASTLARYLLLCVFLTMSFSCSADDRDPIANSTATHEFDGEQAVVWIDAISSRIQIDAHSPPVAARIFAYSSVAIYESVVDGMENHQSLGGQLNEFDDLPPLISGAHDFATVLHAALGHLMPTLFDDAESQQFLRDLAAQRIEKRRTQGIKSSTITRSIQRGVLLAEVIDSWAWSDGFYERNGREFTPPTGSHVWEPLVPDGEPLEPRWGNLRTFAMPTSDACQPPPPEEFSTDPASSFYHQAMLVYEATEDITEDQRHIAEFWADNPGETSTPPGHWMTLAAQMVDTLQLDLADTAELFALLGIAAADSFISCWDEKYRSYLLRPVTYINLFIDEDWETIISTPPFPEYTSGHSNVSAASAQILTELLGEFYFEDRVHEGRGFGTRAFESFNDAAQEAAFSRLYGGIHYPMGIDYGLPQGACVADFVIDRVQTRRE